jgi:lysyl-tRNA synthetase class 2
LGNGFHELQAAGEQRSRFIKDLAYRKQEGLPDVPLDERLLAALDQGLPDCAGIAMGIDRLVMLALGCQAIEEVLSFDFAGA